MNNMLSKYFVRYPIYWMLNKGFFSHFRDLNRTQWLNRDELIELQIEKLSQLLEYSCEKVPFYRDRFKRHGLEISSIQKMEDVKLIPILEKEDIKKHFVELRSRDRYFLPIRLETSGTSGVPLTVLKERAQMAYMDAVAFRNYGWFDIGLGNKQLKFWGGSLSGFRKTRTYWKDLLLNHKRFSPYELNENLYREVIKAIKRRKPDYIYGYSTAIYQFSNYLWRNGITLDTERLKAVICTAETLFGYQKEIIEKALNVPVSREYGCTEIGVIGMECKFNRMHVMSDTLLVETCNNDENGIGDILVTDLNSRLFPLIRYKVGDRGKIESLPCECGRELPVLTVLSGRCEEYITCPDGTLVDPYVFEHILKEVSIGHGHIEQFRIIQKALDKILVELVTNAEIRSDNLESIRRKFSARLRNQIQISIQCVDHLQRDKSGKLRCFISEINGG